MGPDRREYLEVGFKSEEIRTGGNKRRPKGELLHQEQWNWMLVTKVQGCRSVVTCPRERHRLEKNKAGCKTKLTLVQLSNSGEMGLIHWHRMMMVQTNRAEIYKLAEAPSSECSNNVLKFKLSSSLDVLGHVKPRGLRRNCKHIRIGRKRVREEGTKCTHQHERKLHQKNDRIISTALKDKNSSTTHLDRPSAALPIYPAKPGTNHAPSRGACPPPWQYQLQRCNPANPTNPIS